MMPNTGLENRNVSKAKRIFLLLGVIFIASNLRAPITSVGPVLTEISEEIELSNVAAAFITTIPLLAFAFLSGLVPRFSRKYGMEFMLFCSLVLLTIGIVVRPLGGIVSMFLGAGLIGVGITVSNVLMPAFIRSTFAKVGVVMGIYSVAMNLMAALASGFSISIGQITDLGWKGSIGIWALLSTLTIVIWLPQLKKKKEPITKEIHAQAEPKVSLFKSSLAWSVTIFMGAQSLLFYSLIAWLPKVVQTWGMSVEDSGWVLSYIQFATLPMTFIGAIVASKLKSQRGLAVLVASLFILGISGIALYQTTYIVLCSILIGSGGGLAFSLAMLFFVLRTRNGSQAADLSGMAQSFGYTIAAFGPPVFGALFDRYDSWTPSFIFLLVIALVLLVSGVIAGRNTYVK